MSTEPTVVEMPARPLMCTYCMTEQPARPLMCTYCMTEHRGRLATHTVDGTSVCRRHLAEAINWARGKRTGR